MSDETPSGKPARGLGRGLSSLLGETAPKKDTAAPAAPNEVPIELIRRNPDQPRKTFDDVELEALAQSIRTHGILQPIMVRPMPQVDGEFQIIAGERRWRAAQRAGLHTVPVRVVDMDDRDVLEVAILENVQRADSNVLEEAQGYADLMQTFGRTQEEIAQAIGKSRSHVANLLRLLALPEGVKALLAGGQISAGHARALLGAQHPDKLAKLIVDKGLSVRQVEFAVRQEGEPKGKPVKNSPNTDDSPQSQAKRAERIVRPEVEKDPDTVALEADIASVLGLCVDVRHFGSEGGEVVVRYETLEQLDDVCRRLSRHSV